MKNVYAEESHNAEHDEIQHFCLKPNKIRDQKIVIFAVYKVKCKYLYKFQLKKRGRQYAMYKLIFVLKMSWMSRINNVLAEYEKRRIDKRNKITYIPYLV